jgi:hypothetical protein
MDTNVIFFGFAWEFSDKFWISFRKMSRIDISLSVSGSYKIKFRMISFAIKFSKLYSLEILEVQDGSIWKWKMLIHLFVICEKFTRALPAHQIYYSWVSFRDFKILNLTQILTNGRRRLTNRHYFALNSFLLSTYKFGNYWFNLQKKNNCKFSRFRTFYTWKTSLERNK